MRSIIEKIKIHGIVLFSLVIVLAGAILVLVLRLGIEPELDPHACYNPDFQPTSQVLTSNDAFSQLKPITADNIANITQVTENERLENFRELIAEITFSPLEVIMPNGDVLLRATESQEIVAKLSLSEQDPIGIGEFNPSNTCVVFGGSSKKVRFFSTITGQEQKTIQAGNWVSVITFSPDGKMLAYGTEGDNDSIGEVTIGIWDLESNKELHILKGHSWPIRSLVFSSDGKTLASGSSDGAIRLWNTQTGQEIKVLETYTEPIMDLAFNHEGDLLAIATINTVSLWNLEMVTLFPLPMNTNQIEDIFFGPEDSFIAIVGADADQIWTVE